MERLCDLYFELSNEERLGILYLLREKNNTLTGLSEELGIRNQQCSRHLVRLTEFGLIKKTVDGEYAITDYGSVVLRLQPALSFMTTHSEYLQTHSLDGVPGSSLATIGELAESSMVSDLNLALFTIERIINESKETLYEVTNQFHLNTIGPRNEALNRGVRLKSIEAQDSVMPSAIREWFRSHPDYIETTYGARDEGRIEEKVVEKVPYLLHMSENEAFIAFPESSGGFDQFGFSSKDQGFLDWCRALFETTWRNNPTKGEKIKGLYSIVLKDESLEEQIRSFSGENTRLEGLGLSLGQNLTVIGEILQLYLKKGAPLSSIEPEFYWKQMRQ